MSWVRGCRRPSLALAAILLTLAACAPEPTPLPVLPVATTPAPAPTAAAGTLPVVVVDSLTLSLLAPDARARLDSVAVVQPVETVAGTAGGALSIIPFEGGALTAYGVNIAALVNSIPPLDDPALATALRTFLAGRDLVALRLALANAGYPDGLTLTVAGEPSILGLALPTGPIRWEAAREGPAALVVAAGADADILVGEGGLLLGALPLVARGWQVGRGDDGLPLFTPPPAG